MERRFSVGETIAKIGQTVTSVKDPNVQKNLIQLHTELTQHVQSLQAENDVLAATVAKRDAAAAAFNVQLIAANAALAERDAKLVQLQKQVDAAKTTATSATPQSIATAFKNVMETIQTQARQTPGTGTTIKSMQIEVKGVVQVQGDSPTMVFPAPGAAVDPAHLSTLKVEFAAVPTVPAAVSHTPPSS